MKKDIIEPIISIITPYYNAQDYIEETAKSVLNQTFPYYEWIIVDDGSSKEGQEKLKEIERLDTRIKVFKFPQKGRIFSGKIPQKDPSLLGTSLSVKSVIWDLLKQGILE